MSANNTPTVLLTGSNSGIGRAAARRFAERGVHLILHARTEENARQVRDELARETGNERLETAAADLSSPDEIRRMAGALRDRHPHLDVLINNAGLPGGEPHTWTVNVVAPFLLAHELKPLLAAAPGQARLLNVASTAQAAIDLDLLPEEKGAEGPSSYSRSKLALVMLSFEMARRWRGEGILVNSLHPGTLLDTRMVRERYGAPRGKAEEGAEVLEHLALSEELDGVSGVYFDQKDRARAEEQAYDENARHRLWEITTRMAGLAA
ncbi:MAG: SDR family NAD(P)-dependent oxidoreductase [Candidatus Eisenbacteria bacterium]|nr:SDR family NAD(P)-dependent oxidoreductase [Candidatus Latescibacterota bacterium]MBD3301508.1 SDR family NAD(P)-dependent oxidoreductase [Candidatus Eisenbacteria bacterium]